MQIGLLYGMTKKKSKDKKTIYIVNILKTKKISTLKN